MDSELESAAQKWLRLLIVLTRTVSLSCFLAEIG